MSECNVMITHTPSIQGSYPILHIPSSIIRKLQIPTHHPLSLHVVDDEQQIVCMPVSTKSNSVQFDEQLATQLGIPEHSQLKLSYSGYSGQSKLKLGPVLAILVSTLSKLNPPYGKLNAFCEEVIVYARSRHIFAYVTSVEHLLKADRNVAGWTYYKNKWIETKCPFPQVVYNRIGSRKVERTKYFRDLKDKLVLRRAHLFNDTFLNKWEVFEKLSEKKLQLYLPKTQPFGPLALKALIDQYTTVFVKPIHGSLGNGIYRITKTGSGYVSQYTTKTGQIHKNFDKLSQLYNYLSKRVNPRSYIVQQGVPLLHLQERTIDFRALMQKNINGKWSMTSMVARVGPENRFVSNIARGGEIYKVVKILSFCGFKQPKTIRAKLVQVAKKSSEAIEECYKNQFGELGVDLGVSRSGQVYLLEINSKPSKTDDTVPFTNSKGRPSVHRLLDYTEFLTNHSAK